VQPLISSPAYNKSGTGSLSTTPKPLTSPGEFDSIPTGAPAEGHDADDGEYETVRCFFGLTLVTQIISGMSTPILQTV
jgi:hypothetical protein